LKLLYPNKVFLLRGNHETRDVNGWEDHYVEKSFLYQCKDRFGKHIGEDVWEQCNRVFDRLPLSCVIDKEIFCVHGGIPRTVTEDQSELEAIMSVPVVSGVMPAYEYETDEMRQICTDCLWSDPAPAEDEDMDLDINGFGDSVRGGEAPLYPDIVNYLIKV
jgi:diadenosine tetraphosphatase ApaH/serine/threonine PP2A family protein phosphatase